MARIAGLFIDAASSPEDLARRVAEAQRASLSPGSTADIWELGIGDETLVLSPSDRSGSESDPLRRRYRHVLSATMAEGTTAGHSPQVHALRAVAEDLRETPGVAVLLVVDLQNQQKPASSLAQDV